MSKATLPFTEEMKALAREQSKGHIQAAFIEELLTKRQCQSKLVDIPGRYIDGHKPQARIYGDCELSQNSWRNLGKRLKLAGFNVVEMKHPGTVQLLFAEGDAPMPVLVYAADENAEPKKVTPKVPNAFTRSIATLKQNVDHDRKILAGYKARRVDIEREYKRMIERQDGAIIAAQQNYDESVAAVEVLTKASEERANRA